MKLSSLHEANRSHVESPVDDYAEFSTDDFIAIACQFLPAGAAGLINKAMNFRYWSVNPAGAKAGGDAEVQCADTANGLKPLNWLHPVEVIRKYGLSYLIDNERGEIGFREEDRDLAELFLINHNDNFRSKITIRRVLAHFVIGLLLGYDPAEVLEFTINSAKCRPKVSPVTFRRALRAAR